VRTIQTGWRRDEKNLSTKQCEKKKNPWLSGSHEDEGWADDPETKKGQRAKTIGCVRSFATTMKELGFPKEHRLRRRAEFIPKGGSTWKRKTRHFKIVCSENRKGVPRLGIVASKKVGNAVIRNRIKRLIREFFRLNRIKIHRSEDIIVIARPMARIIRYRDVEEELWGLLHRS
jgi:ribonuclease P protein component